MFRSLSAFALSLLFSTQINAAKDWVVIVSGSNGFDNYRHHADVCHAYKIASQWGVPNDQIITMLYDDVANSPYNPYPGKLFNKPTDKGTPGVDVYADCQKDYVGEDVTAENFLKILGGDESAGGKVLKSTSEDNVFINFVDHGAPGLIAMPAGPYLYAKDLLAALNLMWNKKMYNKLVFYVEACESGSLFEGLFPDNVNAYVTTASNAVESSWGTYCSPDDSVNGVSVGSCLGDLYSVNWMENSDSVGEYETLDEQFQLVRNKTDLSHVMFYGDDAFQTDPIGNFQGNLIADTKLHHHRRHKSPHHTIAPNPSTTINSRDIELHNAYYRYAHTNDVKLAAKHQERLSKILTVRQQTDSFFTALSSSFNNTFNGLATYYTAPTPKSILACDHCCKSVEKSIRKHCGGLSDYGLKYFSVVTNMCAAGNQSPDTTANLVSTVRDLCENNQYNLANVPLV